MRRIMTTLACFALVAIGWSDARAQEAEYSSPEYSGPMYREVTTFDVSPGDAGAFEMAVEKIVEAANQADLAADYGWLFFRDGSKFTLVYPVGSMAYFDDPDQWMRKFSGTPGEATLMQAFESFGKLNYSSKTEILKVNPDHSYDPPSPIEKPNFVMVYQGWVKPGKQEAFAANTAKLVQILKDVQWRYAVHAYDGLIGDGGLHVYVVPFDDRATYYGEGSLPAYLAQHEKGDDWDAVIGERMKLLRAMDNFEMAFVPGMTYMPAMEGGGE